MKNKYTRKGFTIVELVIVIAVIAILAAVLIPTFSNLIQKSKKSADQQLIRNLNTALTTDAAVNGKHVNMQSALDAAFESGYDVGKINATATGNEILWDQVNDVFCYLDGDEIKYIPNSVETGLTKGDYRLWVISDKVDQNYSTYYIGTDATVNTTKGFDAGKNSFITAINYINTDTSKPQTEVIIRTNGGTLTVNAPSDTIKHYGEAQVITLTAVGTNSFYENGRANQVNIQKGRFVMTNSVNAAVKTIYIMATGTAYDNIILATQSGAQLPALIARDNVPLPTGSDTKKVVTIQTDVDTNGENAQRTETISLFPTHGTTGNDVKEATNGYDVTALALLIVEASSTEAQTQASTQIQDADVLAKVNESKATFEVRSEADLDEGLSKGVKYITIMDNFTTSKVINITYSLIIEGNNKTITRTSENDKRMLWLGNSNISLTIRNLTLDAAQKTARGIQVNSDKTGCEIVLDNVKMLNVTHYAVNFCSNTSGVFTATNCEFSGWNAFNIWGFGHIINISNSVLTGVNDKSNSPWNNFATICFEADTTNVVADDYSIGNTVTITNSTVNAVETNLNKQAIVSYNHGIVGALNNTLILNGCNLNTSNYRVLPGVANGGNKLIVDGTDIDFEASVYDSSITYVDITGVSLNTNTATGTLKVSVDRNDLTLSLSEARTNPWDQTKNYGATFYGTDYCFYYTKGNVVYLIDLDVSPCYAEGYNVKLSCDGVK